MNVKYSHSTPSSGTSITVFVAVSNIFFLYFLDRFLTNYKNLYTLTYFVLDSTEFAISIY